jgi:hypothetical protein
MRANVRLALQLAMVGSVMLAVAGMLLIADRQLDLKRRDPPPSRPASITEPAQPTPAAPAAATAGIPLPSVYGVYAVSGGELFELQPLPGRVPDAKVFMSTAIKTPSLTTLPDGRLVFVVHRRDIAANAPTRVQVRVITRVMRTMSFNAAGEASTLPVEDSWTIRSNTHELRVGPIPEHPEMLLLRPDDADFVFPAGRYGVVLKGQAYDFTVAGQITDPAHCLERIEAANGVFYSECRLP